MSSNNSPSTLQSTIDSVKGAAQSVLGTVTGNEADKVSPNPNRQYSNTTTRARSQSNGTDIIDSKKRPTTKTKLPMSRTPHMQQPKSAISLPPHRVLLPRTTQTALKARGTKRSARVRR